MRPGYDRNEEKKAMSTKELIKLAKSAMKPNEKEVNSMCINCEKYKRGECYTTEKVWTGCVRREVKR